MLRRGHPLERGRHSIRASWFRCVQEDLRPRGLARSESVVGTWQAKRERTSACWATDRAAEEVAGTVATSRMPFRCTRCSQFLLQRSVLIPWRRSPRVSPYMRRTTNKWTSSWPLRDEHQDKRQSVRDDLRVDHWLARWSKFQTEVSTVRPDLRAMFGSALPNKVPSTKVLVTDDIEVTQYDVACRAAAHRRRAGGLEAEQKVAKHTTTVPETQHATLFKTLGNDGKIVTATLWAPRLPAITAKFQVEVTCCRTAKLREHVMKNSVVAVNILPITTPPPSEKRRKALVDAS